VGTPYFIGKMMSFFKFGRTNERYRWSAHSIRLPSKHQKPGSGGRVRIPSCILEYDKYMEGVDRSNQYLSYNMILWKTVK
jgi:hypothetical protein